MKKEKIYIKNFSKDIIGHIGFREIGILFNFKGKEVEFFKSQILTKGLRDFHITINPNISEEEQRKCVREVIKEWNSKKVKIENL